MTTYRWPGFALSFDPATGEAYTRYPGGNMSGCGVVEGDRHHAPRLGITPEEHRLAHELCHHLVGIHVLDAPGSPIIRRDAFHEPQPNPDPDHEEWMVTALTYAAYGRGAEHGALIDIGRRTNLVELIDQTRWLLAAPRLGISEVAL